LAQQLHQSLPRAYAVCFGRPAGQYLAPGVGQIDRPAKSFSAISRSWCSTAVDVQQTLVAQPQQVLGGRP
jgi:hypothetical protein